MIKTTENLEVESLCTRLCNTESLYIRFPSLEAFVMLRELDSADFYDRLLKYRCCDLWQRS